MDRHYRALVIGGGVVGCNVLYHLTREGWSDVALCERRELTAGATWHSSGHISAYTGDLTRVDLARYTRSQIDRLRTEVEQDLGLRSAGSLRIMMTMGGLADNVGYSPEALVIDESMLSGVLRSVRGIAARGVSTVCRRRGTRSGLPAGCTGRGPDARDRVADAIVEHRP